MANPLPDEEALYNKIRNEKITIPPFVWDAMYNFLGDYVSVINLLASYYVHQNQPIAIADARKILEYTRRSMDAVRKIIHPENITEDDARYQKVKTEAVVLHPLIREFYTHYLGNDMHIINMCVSFYLDPRGEEPVPVPDARKILNCTLSIHKFLDRLREATTPG